MRILPCGGEEPSPRVLAKKTEREILGTYPEPGSPPIVLRRVRSTLLSSALVELRARGLYDRYWGYLDPSARPPMESIIAGVWVPVDLAMAHYEACERLELSPQVAFEIGAGVGKRIHDTIFSVLTRAARGAGVTPWTAIQIYTRLYARTFDGGEVRVYKAGPKDAEIDIQRMPLLRFGYFRQSWLGVHRVGALLFAQQVFIRLTLHRDPDSVTFKLSWV
jgi:hypothetical protein